MSLQRSPNPLASLRDPTFKKGGGGKGKGMNKEEHGQGKEWMKKGKGGERMEVETTLPSIPASAPWRFSS